MAELVGVITGVNLLQPSFMKRTALLFDRIAIPQLSGQTLNQWLQVQPAESNELLSLIESGLVFQTKLPDPGVIVDETSHMEVEESMMAVQESLNDLFGGDHGQHSREDLTAQFRETLTKGEVGFERKLLGNYIRATEHFSRIIGCFLRNEGVKAYPVLSFNLKTNVTASPSQVLEIIFKKFPTPSDQTPWEQILEYRSDPSSRAKLLDLKNWVNDVVRDKLTAVEVEEKLEYLLSQISASLATSQDEGKQWHLRNCNCFRRRSP